MDLDDNVVFEIFSNKDSDIRGPRLGCLSIKGRKDLESPNYLAISSRGVIPHMTPDVIAAHSGIVGIHLALEDFIEKKNALTLPPIMKYPGDQSPIHTFTALPTSLITLLTPRRTPAVSTPTGNTNTSISLYTSTGFQVLSNETYIEAMQNLKPDIAISLADIAHNSIPGIKRLAKMGDRTQAWLMELLDSKEPNQAVFATILPINHLAQLEYLDFLADHAAGNLSGLAFYDSNLLPDIPATTALSKLPRLSLDEPGSPHHILRQISLGMDIFTIPFITFATDGGIALTFEFPRPSPSSESLTSSMEDGSDTLPLGIDMWQFIHSSSLLPLIPSCTCYTCTSHHRAYIQHLLSAKEMLGWVLLQIHNHHTISTFFDKIRDSIKEGMFEEDCKVFEKFYESTLPEKTGLGPRVRGYHFKSEGPGEKKKNKPAWGTLGGGEVQSGDVIRSAGERGALGGEDEGLVPNERGKDVKRKGFAEVAEG